ncbi:O-antigen biosynthesis glycosyltransferase WbnH [Chitinophaga sp. MM2321]
MFLITKSEVGGAQKYVKEQIDISVNQFDVFLATNEVGWLTENIADKTMGLLLDKRIESRMAFGYLIKLIKYIKQHQIDLVVCNSANGGLYGRIAAKLTGASSIYVSHGWSSVYNGGRLTFILNRIERFLGNISGKTICVSNNDYLTAQRKIGLAEDKLILLKNCIFPVELQLSAPSNRRGAGSRLKLLSLARLAYPKRMDILIEAMSGIDFAELYLIGLGPDEEEIKKDVYARRLDNVFLLGEVKSFNSFADYHAFILISDSEGLPMSALEAMSAGLPLILSNVGGCSEIVVNPSLLVENSVEDIHRALFELNENFDSYKLPVKDFFDKNFNLLLNKDKYLNLYSSLIK